MFKELFPWLYWKWRVPNFITAQRVIADYRPASNRVPAGITNTVATNHAWIQVEVLTCKMKDGLQFKSNLSVKMLHPTEYCRVRLQQKIIIGGRCDIFCCWLILFWEACLPPSASEWNWQEDVFTNILLRFSKQDVCQSGLLHQEEINFDIGCARVSL